MTTRNLFVGKLFLKYLSQSRALLSYNDTRIVTQVRQYSGVLCKNTFNLDINKQKLCAFPPAMDVQCRYASGATTTKDLEPKSKEKERLDKAKSKRAEPPPILLMDEREAISVISLEDAGKLAKKRGLYLVESVDHGMKSGKQVYKLVSKSQFYGDDWKTKKEGTDPQGKKPKEEKSVLLKGKISDHDVAIKTKQILKLVEKGHTVRVSIGQVGIQNQNPEAVYKVMENLLKDEPVKILQKVVTSAQVRFQILPSKDTDAKPNAPQNTKDKVKSESVSDKP